MLLRKKMQWHLIEITISSASRSCSLTKTEKPQSGYWFKCLIRMDSNIMNNNIKNAPTKNEHKFLADLASQIIESNPEGKLLSNQDIVGNGRALVQLIRQACMAGDNIECMRGELVEAALALLDKAAKTEKDMLSARLAKELFLLDDMFKLLNQDNDPLSEYFFLRGRQTAFAEVMSWLREPSEPTTGL